MNTEEKDLKIEEGMMAVRLSNNNIHLLAINQATAKLLLEVVFQIEKGFKIIEEPISKAEPLVKFVKKEEEKGAS